MILETLIGTICGFIGTGITAYTNYKMKQMEIEEGKAKRQHELDMVKAESEARIAEVQANIQVAQVQTEGAVLLEEARAFTESQKQGNRKIFDSEWVTALLGRQDGWRFLTIPLASLICAIFGLSDAVQALMRPLLTLYCCGIATWVTWRAWEIMQTVGISSFTAQQAMSTWDQSTGVAYTLSVTLITWWFGDRQFAKNSINRSRPPKH
jgi:hypothetical protein